MGKDAKGIMPLPIQSRAFAPLPIAMSGNLPPPQ